MAILEDRFTALRQRQEIAPTGSAMLGDHVYRLTDVGRDRALKALSLRTLGELELSPAGGADGLPRLPAETSLRDRGSSKCEQHARHAGNPKGASGHAVRESTSDRVHLPVFVTQRRFLHSTKV